MTSPAPAIALGGLTKRYGSRRGIDDVTLRGDAGEVFGLAVATYLLNAFPPAVNGLGWAAKLSPCHHYTEGPPLPEGLHLAHAAVLAAIAAAALLGPLLLFDRRDIRS